MQPTPTNGLPAADAASLAHSQQVAAHLRREIAAADGAISFARYMHEVLYAPGLGYYSAGATKFGAAGDFTTAPEISPLFGAMLARQCAEVMTPSANHVLELGAGSGKLAVAVLTRLRDLDALPDQYRILEVSPDLSARQEKLLRNQLPDMADRVVWCQELPSQHRGVILANEVLDALPVERFVRRNGELQQFVVTVEGADFAQQERAAPPELAAAVAAVEADLGATLPDDYVSEICLAAPALVGDLARCLASGVLWLFDYGVTRSEYYAPDRAAGWLRCHFRHHAHSDPLLLPGIQDITAWVDFSGVAAAAVANGLDVAGFVSQAHFLLNAGLADELQQLSELAPASQLQLASDVKMLTLPGEMGESFKCLGLSRNVTAVPSAFANADRTFSL